MGPQTGLSFEQAPPFSLPLRFFLTGPLFLLAAALIVLFAPASLDSRWTPQALALTHALTLGFLGMTMLGALLQMLPVVAGSPLPAPRAVARVGHAGLTLGTAVLMAAFLGNAPATFGLAAALLGGGFTVFLAAAAVSLTRAAAGATVTGMRLAATALAVTAALGVSLALLRAGWWVPPRGDALASAHVAFGLLGWVLLLVVGVAYQVVPMFQMTPPYPPVLSRWLAGAMFLLLLVHAGGLWLPPLAGDVADLGIAAGVLLFASVTLRLQRRRRRKLPDTTLDFWRVGMVSLIACVALWLGARFAPAWASGTAYPLLLGVLFIGGFVASVVVGMLYKIVPFLAWFHLQAQLQARAGTIPNMKQMIDSKKQRNHLRLHLAACVLLLAAAIWPRLFHVPAGIALGLSALRLLANLASAVQLYLRHGGRLA